MKFGRNRTNLDPALAGLIGDRRGKCNMVMRVGALSKGRLKKLPWKEAALRVFAPEKAYFPNVFGTTQNGHSLSLLSKGMPRVFLPPHRRCLNRA